MKTNPIDLSFVSQQFENHLNINNNFRILFSGPFGIGKSYFINEYFGKRTKEYNTIRISPVNYSLGSNEDIFEYLKYDILNNIFGFEGLQIDSIDISDFNSLPFFILNNPEEFIAPLLNLLPSTGTNFFAIYEKYIQLYKKFLDEKSNNNGELLKIFGNKFINQKGGIHEDDIYSKLIFDYLVQLKNLKPDSKNILILDDIDRVDPGHMFRLFNIFASHFSHDSNDNKFGFDQIIFVCDVKNLREIFAGKYGSQVDFSGYIDKYFSYDIYQYDNSKAIVKWYLESFKNLSIKSRSLDNYGKTFILKKLNTSLSEFESIIEFLIKFGNLNLRKIIKFLESGYNYEPEEFIIVKNRIFDWQIDILLFVQFLSKTYGDIEDLIIGIEKARLYVQNTVNYKSFNTEAYICIMLPILYIKQHKLKLGQYKYPPKLYGAELNHDFKLLYNLKSDESSRLTYYYCTISDLNQGANNLPISDLNTINIELFEMFYDVVRECKGFLKV